MGDMFLIKLMIHVSFLIPIYFGKYFFAVAVLLLVASAYIKTKKYEQLLSGKALSEREKLSYSRTLRFWKSFTFLK